MEIVPTATSSSSQQSGITAVSLNRVAQLAKAAFRVHFAQVIRFGDGDGVAAEPISAGAINGRQPDLRLVCAGLPPAATMVVVEDTLKDARKIGGLPRSVRFFALARIESEQGRALGAVCIVDDSPRTLSSIQADRLTDLTALAAGVLGAEELANLESRVAECEARFQALSESVFDALLITAEGVIVDANELAAKLIGIDNHELLIGRHVTDLVPEDKIDLVQGQLAVSGRYEVPVVHADGREILVEVQATTFPHEGQNLRVAAVRRVSSE